MRMKLVCMGKDISYFVKLSSLSWWVGSRCILLPSSLLHVAALWFLNTLSHRQLYREHLQQRRKALHQGASMSGVAIKQDMPTDDAAGTTASSSLCRPISCWCWTCASTSCYWAWAMLAATVSYVARLMLDLRKYIKWWHVIISNVY